jgi:hypothetical protein
MLRLNGMEDIPDSVAEIGPGDSFGAGIAAMLTGVREYFALDVTARNNPRRDVVMLDELADMFRNREPIPSESEFASLKPALDSYEFPDFLTTEILSESLDPRRITAIRLALEGTPTPGGPIIHAPAPWADHEVIEPSSVQLMFSQAALEHVEDLADAYHAMSSWLQPGGRVSHEVDLKSHGFASTWNGHWQYSDLAWKMIRWGREWTINGAPVSQHVELATQAGLEVDGLFLIRQESGIRRSKLAKRNASLSPDDLSTSGFYMRGHKPA